MKTLFFKFLEITEIFIFKLSVTFLIIYIFIILQTLDTKLLHPGVQTGDILSAYIAAIRALRVLDGSGVILELVCTNLRYIDLFINRRWIV